MEETLGKEHYKDTLKDTQILIKSTMTHHKNLAKKLFSQIKKDKKTIDLFKEKIAKLSVEKEKLEMKENSATTNNAMNFEINSIKSQIMKEIQEKKDFDDKTQEIKDEITAIKNNMGGIDANFHQKEKYEKHIKILENRLDKANQKFNESIEYDKKLRDEIDKLRKERFFFEK
jgi:hypothetical protein